LGGNASFPLDLSFLSEQINPSRSNFSKFWNPPFFVCGAVNPNESEILIVAVNRT
jgi:hypothetical protein